MKKLNEIIKELNDKKIIQNEYYEDFLYNLEDQYKEYFEGFEIVDENLYTEKHRYYETNITVLETKYGLIGVELVTSIFSEMMGVEDCYHIVKFYEMEKVVNVTYVKK